MARDRRDFEDDGRTIADMSDVSRPSLFGHLPVREKGTKPLPQEAVSQGPEQEPLSPEARRWAILGALKAALLIGMAFIVGLGLVILLLLLIWGAF